MKKILMTIIIGMFLLSSASASVNLRQSGEMFLQGGNNNPLSIKNGLNITTGHLFISAGDLHIDGNIVHDIGNFSFSGGYFDVNGSIKANRIYLGDGGTHYIDRSSGDDWIRFSEHLDVPGITSSGALDGDSITAATADITDLTETPIIRNADGDTLTVQDKLSVTGAIDSDISIDVPEISNTAGFLKIQPDVQGDVIFFGDTDVGNAENSKYLYLYRMAPEGNSYMRMYISSTEKGYFHSNVPMNFQAQQQFTINSVTDDVLLKVGDNAGTYAIRFKDSDNADIARINSDGLAWFDGPVGIGTDSPTAKLEISNVVEHEDYKAIVFADAGADTYYFNANYSGQGQDGNWITFADVWGNDIQTWRDGKVGIGTTNPSVEFDVDGDTKLDGVLNVTGISYLDGDSYFGRDLYIERDVYMETSDYIYFHDTDISIGSEADGHLDLTADDVIDMNAQEIRLMGRVLLSQTEVSISSGGAITVIDSNHRVDTYSGAATDNLDTINGGLIGQILFLRTVNNGRDITIRDEVGNIKLSGGNDFTMDTKYDNIMLMYDTTGGGHWFEIERSNID